jgi:cation transport regulator ChaC
VSPQSSSEDLALWLLLYLSQEPMIEETYEVLGFVMHYLRPFCKRLHEVVGQTWHPDKVGLVAGDPLAGTLYEVFRSSRSIMRCRNIGRGDRPISGVSCAIS